MTEILDMEVRPVATNREAVQGVDVLLSVTNSNVPTFDGDWLEPGVHLCSIVSSNIGLKRGGFIQQKRREVDDKTLQRCDIIVCNSKEQEILDEPGVLWDPVQQGVITWDDVWIWARSSPDRCRAGRRRSRSASTRTTPSGAWATRSSASCSTVARWSRGGVPSSPSTAPSTGKRRVGPSTSLR